MTKKNVYDWGRVTNNRYVVDSERYWRAEFHPRFKSLFDLQDFADVVETVNNTLSYPLEPTQVDAITLNLYNYLRGSRFAEIPCKNPDSVAQFLADLFFILDDFMGRLSYKRYKIKDDDFNIVHNTADSGSTDTTNQMTNEQNRLNTLNRTAQEALRRATAETVDRDFVGDVGEIIDTNQTDVLDTFLSPQNQGQGVTNTNTKHQGVAGVPLVGSAGFSTNSSANKMGNSVIGDTIDTQDEVTQTDATEDNDNATTGSEATNETAMSHATNNTAVKDDRLIARLDFDKAARLKDFYAIQGEPLWQQLLKRVSLWTLKIDIATSDRNYYDCVRYD